MKEERNILIAGLGGQGVNTLYAILQSLLLKAGFSSKGAIFKGGAQKRGSVYAMIRIVKDGTLENHFSPMIPEGQLDVLIALEAYEALRYSRFYHPQTSLLVNNHRVPFFNERYQKKTSPDPIKTLQTHFKNLIIQDFNSLSMNLLETRKMVNILMGLAAIEQKWIPIEPTDFLDAAQQKLSLPYNDMLILMKEINV